MPGHIPGAVNVSAASLYEDGRMPTDDGLRELLSPALGPVGVDPQTPVAAYCGSGVSAARDILALAVLGVDASLFPGAWSAWSNDPAARRPGAQPGRRTLDTGPDVHRICGQGWGQPVGDPGRMGQDGKRRENAVTGQGTTPDTC